MHLPIGDALFRYGLLIAGVSAALLLLSLALGMALRKRLMRKLEQEYGKKRH